MKWIKLCIFCFSLIFTCCLFIPSAVAQDSLALNKVDTIKKQIYTTRYHSKFEGRKTTSGERYRAKKFTAAHRSLPFGTMVKVTNLKNGKSVVVKVNDRGPFSKKYALDVSYAAAKALGIAHLGHALVEIAYVLKK